MSKSVVPTWILVVTLILLIFNLVFLEVAVRECNKLRSEAVEYGYAEWYSEKLGNAPERWRWIKPSTTFWKEQK